MPTISDWELGENELFTVQEVQKYIDRIHPDVKELIYIEEQRPLEVIDEDPGAIYLDVKIYDPSNSYVSALGYYPRYTGIDPWQRAQYLRFLSDPFHEETSSCDYEVGYAFMLLYSLERRLHEGDYLSAIYTIRRLMATYRHNSFDFHAKKAIFFACVQREDNETLKREIEKYGIEHLAFSLNSEMYLKAIAQENFTASDLYRHRKHFYEVDPVFTRKEDAYVESLKSKMKFAFGSDQINLGTLYHDALFLPKSRERACYESLALRNVEIDIIDLCGVPSFYEGCVFCLQETNREFKKAKWSSPSKDQEIYRHHGCQITIEEELFYRMLVEYIERHTIYTIKDVSLKFISNDIIQFSLSYWPLGRINFRGSKKKISIKENKKQYWNEVSLMQEAFDYIPRWITSIPTRNLLNITMTLERNIQDDYFF